MAEQQVTSQRIRPALSINNDTVGDELGAVWISLDGIKWVTQKIYVVIFLSYIYYFVDLVANVPI